MRHLALWVCIGWGLACAAGPLGPLRAEAQPVDARRHFEIGNQRYAQGQYQRAIDAYEAALDTGYVSGALYYNLGNAYFRTGDTGQAILHYEKAQRLLPAHPKLRHSLDVARSRAGLPPPPAPQGWHTLATAVDPATVFFIGLILYLLGAGVLGYRLWKRRRPVITPMGAGPLAVGLLLVALALGASWLGTLDRRAVVVSDAPLYGSPIGDAARDTTLQEGAVLTPLRRQPGWTEVRLSNGRVGWLRAEALADV